MEPEQEKPCNFLHFDLQRENGLTRFNVHLCLVAKTKLLVSVIAGAVVLTFYRGLEYLDDIIRLIFENL